MTWNYVYTPAIWSSVLTVLLLLVLGLYSGRRRKVPGALLFTIGSLFAALWAAGSCLEIAAVEVATKVFWVKFQAVWQLPAVTTITCFLLVYTWPGRRLTRRILAILTIPCLVGIVLILTDDLHHWMWRSLVSDGLVDPVPAPGGGFLIAYGYGLGLVEIIVFAWLFLRSPQHRWPVTIMLAGLMGGRTLHLLSLSRTIQSSLPVDVFAIAVVFLAYAIALFGFRILDPIPLANKMAIEQLHTGMLVLDPQGRVVNMNPAAEQILRLPANRARDRMIRELLPAYLEADLADTEGVEIDFSLGEGQQVQHFAMELSLLKDWRGLEVGRLLMLRDVTEQRQAQAQMVAQQQALAMLRERERLARELHDSLGQVFAFVNAQGQTIKRLLRRGEFSTAMEYLDRLVEVARETDVDIRESILGLRVALPEKGFFPALEQYLVRYEKNYGIQIAFEKPENPPVSAIEPLVEVQLLRILQEALTNVRKHAKARNVRIVFAFEDGWVCVTIQDDGQGFDPGEQRVGSGEGVGLRVMGERAEDIGGHLSLHTKPGEGTVVEVRVPLNGKNRKESRVR